LWKLVESAEKGTRKPDRYALVDTGGWSREHRYEWPANADLLSLDDGGPHGPNVGLPAVWNRVMERYPDWVIFSNDDVEFGPYLVENLAKAADESSALFLFPHEAGAMFCVALIKHLCWDRVGPFDEKFWPGYFEDNDYHRRMKLLGIEELQVKNTDYYHHVSATLNSLNGEERRVHDANFRRNEMYYRHKWGGPPGHETLTEPRKPGE
jgi:GT2 family glycosyltransferase